MLTGFWIPGLTVALIGLYWFIVCSLVVDRSLTSNTSILVIGIWFDRHLSSASMKSRYKPTIPNLRLTNLNLRKPYPYPQAMAHASKAALEDII